MTLCPVTPTFAQELPRAKPAAGHAHRARSAGSASQSVLAARPIRCSRSSGHCCSGGSSRRSMSFLIGKAIFTVQKASLARSADARRAAPAGPSSSIGSTSLSTASIRSRSIGGSNIVFVLMAACYCAAADAGVCLSRRSISCSVLRRAPDPRRMFCSRAAVRPQAVPTEKWGGLLLTLIVSVVGIIGSIPHRHPAGARAAIEAAGHQDLLHALHRACGAPCR